MAIEFDDIERIQHSCMRLIGIKPSREEIKEMLKELFKLGDLTENNLKAWGIHFDL